MNKRALAFGAALLMAASVAAGLLYSWTLAFGILWFGASFLALVLTMKSFNKDMSSRLREP